MSLVIFWVSLGWSNEYLFAPRLCLFEPVIAQACSAKFNLRAAGSQFSSYSKEMGWSNHACS